MESTLTQTSTKYPSGALFHCHSGQDVVLYKNKEYLCATDALDAYILDYEQKQQKYYTKNKYEKEVLDLFCPNVKTKTSSWLDHGKAETENTIARIVRESYHKLEEADRETVKSSLSASVKLMKRLENDRLPSPTRRMQPGGRPSAGSVDTDTLLDARPSGIGIIDSGMTKSREFSVQKDSNTPLKSFNRVSSPAEMSAYSANSGVRKSAVGYSSTDHLLRVQPPTVLGKNTSGISTSRERSRKSDYREQQGTSLQHALQKAGVSWSDGRCETDGTKDKTGSALVDGTLKSINKLEERASQPVLLSDSKTHSRIGDRNNAGQSLSGLHIKDIGRVRGESMADVSTKSQSSATTQLADKGMKGRRPQTYNLGKNPQGSYLDLASGAESDGATSSIITGHTVKGALPHRPGLAKVSSTPKRQMKTSDGTKQLRFDVDTSKSSLGQDLHLHDLNTRLSELPPSSELGASFDLSRVHTGTPVKPDIHNGRDNAGILKTFPSPGKSRGAMSRVSFTTDDLLTCDPSGLSPPGRKPRSKSVPRSSNSQLTHLLDTSDMHVLRNPFDRSADASMNRSHKEDSRVSRTDTSLRDIKEAKYKDFLKGLMKDIDDSASSVATLGEGLQLSPNTEKHGTTGTADCKTGGYLERIQKLLSGVPPVSEFLTSDETQDSLATEEVLEGDRPWEKLPAFKPPQPVDSSMNGADDAMSKNMFEDFMAECMAEAEVRDPLVIQGRSENAEGGSSQQLGPLEALKNMLFTVQSLGTSVKDTVCPEEESQPTSVEGSETDDVVDLPLNDSISKLLSPETKKLLTSSYTQGAPSLTKAMEHLTKLKDLVHFNTDDMKTVDEDHNGDDDDDDILGT